MAYSPSSSEGARRGEGIRGRPRGDDPWTRRSPRTGPRRLRRSGEPPIEPEVEAAAPERSVPVVPVPRLRSLATATFAALLGVGLIVGAQTAGVGTARAPFAVVVFGVQLLFAISWALAMRPPAPRVVVAVGLLTAALADLAAVLPTRASLAGLGYATVAGLVAGVIGQLARSSSRVRATESLGATVVVVVGVVAFATLIVLTRITAGTQAIVVGLSSCALSLVVARVMDVIAPYPRLAPQVPRGASGVVLGAMAGSGVGAFLGAWLQGLDPTKGAAVGFIAALAAVLADLSVGYSEAGRTMAGEPGAYWFVAHMQGPLGGFALAAPALYVMSVLFIVPKVAGG